jgi:hypothetical protein
MGRSWCPYNTNGLTMDITSKLCEYYIVYQIVLNNSSMVYDFYPSLSEGSLRKRPFKCSSGHRHDCHTRRISRPILSLSLICGIDVCTVYMGGIYWDIYQSK